MAISNSGSNENGTVYGGKPGDQTGREWQIRTWYNKPWNCILRYPDANVRKKIAELATKAANNNHIGYNQLNRDSFWKQLQKVNYDPSKIAVDCDADCSAGVIAITKAVGHLLKIAKLQNITATYTGNMRTAFKSAGFSVLTASKYLTSDAYLLEGDILLNDKSHTAINLTNGSKAGATTTPTTAGSTPAASTKKTNEEIANEVIAGKWGTGTTRKNKLTAAGYDYNAIQKIVNAKAKTSTAVTNPYTEPVGQVITRGSIGTGAKWVQWHLKRLGYNIGASGVDGIFGSNSMNALLAFQKAKKLTVDGLCGAQTRAALKAAK